MILCESLALLSPRASHRTTGCCCCCRYAHVPLAHHTIFFHLTRLSLLTCVYICMILYIFIVYLYIVLLIRTAVAIPRALLRASRASSIPLIYWPRSHGPRYTYYYILVRMYIQIHCRARRGCNQWSLLISRIFVYIYVHDIIFTRICATSLSACSSLYIYTRKYIKINYNISALIGEGEEILSS